MSVYPLESVLVTVTSSASGAGVVPGMTEPKSSVLWLTATEIIGWRSTPTVPPPPVPPPPPPPPPPDEHAATAEVELCGFGAAVVKSEELSSASVQDDPARTSAVVALSAGAAAVPSNSVADPQPTRSSTPEPELTICTLPPDIARFEVPVASGVGSADPFVPPEASCTR